MVAESYFPRVRQLLPHFESAGQRFKVEVALLMGIAWIESHFDVEAKSEAGALGLMQMMPATAAEVAQKLEVKTWSLLDAATAVRFGAFYFAQQLERFGQPRVALAAYHAGPTAVARAGGQVPPVKAVESYASKAMAAWAWFRDNLGDIEAHSDEPKSRSWRVICPQHNWPHPIPIATSALPVLEEIAERLHLVFNKDEAVRKVYIGQTAPKPAPPPARTALIVPVQGATRASNGAYASDSGIDILAPFGTPVFAAASGTIIYSEFGHTPWINGPDATSGKSILIALDKPFKYGNQLYPLTWYTHLSSLKYHVPDGSGNGPYVEQGEYLGRVGNGRGIPHLHLGVVADRPQTRFVGPFQLAAYFGWMGGDRS